MLSGSVTRLVSWGEMTKEHKLGARGDAAGSPQFCSSICYPNSQSRTFTMVDVCVWRAVQGCRHLRVRSMVQSLELPSQAARGMA